MGEPRRQVCIVIPVLDDWECLSILAAALHERLALHGWTPWIVAVDDGSSLTSSSAIAAGASVVVRLACNVGHQRAIAIGLDYVVRETDAEVIAVMDSDGEDRPGDLPALLAALDDESARIVVATRRRRSEGRRFLLSYKVYKAIFRVLTGEHLNFGNFSVMGRLAARRLTMMHELWLNLPGTVMRARLDMIRLPTDRGERYAGKSRMNVVALTVHGMSAVGVFVERAFTRTLIAVGALAGLLAVGFASALLLKSFGMATPGWLTTIAVALVIVLIQTAMIALCGLLVVFGNACNVALAPATTARALISAVTRNADEQVSGRDIRTRASLVS